MRARLGLNFATDSDGVTMMPPADYTGEESRRAGIETRDEVAS